MWEIKGKDNQTKAIISLLEYNGEWMGESNVTVSVESPVPVDFEIGDYIIYRDERFEINYDPGKIKSAPQFAKDDAFKYENVKFNSLTDELTRCDFLDVVLGDNQLHFTGLPKFSFYGGVQDLANRIQANLDRAYPNQWTVVVSSEYSGTKELNVSVDTQKVWDALSVLVNDFETYFTIKGRTITIGAAGVPAGHLFKYGKGNGLYELEQNAETDQAIVTRLRAYGSTRNLPYRYYNKLGTWSIKPVPVSLFAFDWAGSIPYHVFRMRFKLPFQITFTRETAEATINGISYTIYQYHTDWDNEDWYAFDCDILLSDATKEYKTGIPVYFTKGYSNVDVPEEFRDYDNPSGEHSPYIPDNMAVQYLMLPDFPYTTQDPYIDSENKEALGIREGTIFFDGSGDLEEIYPSIEGMTAEQLHAADIACNSTGALDVLVSAEQMDDNGVGIIKDDKTEADPPTFKVILKDLGFNLWEHRTNDAPTMSFKTGMLGGREFEVIGCKPIKDSADTVTGYELELNRVYDDGIQLLFPNKDYNARGIQQNADDPDKFVLLHIEMPEVYIKAAAQRLKDAAEKWLSKNDYSRSIYAPKIDEIFMARQHDEAMASGGTIKSLHDTLKEGMQLLFEDEDLNIDAAIFIDRLTIKEGDSQVPTYEVVLKEEKTVGRLDKMQNQIDSLVAGKGQSGGYTAAQIQSLIDAYGGARFLSKIKNDRTPYKVSTDKMFEVGEYFAGISGGALGVDENNDSFAEVARLYVRVKAFFEELTTIKASALAGRVYISPGGAIECTKVEDVKDDTGAVTAYRCYFLSEQDGNKTETKFVVGDQVIAEMFNAKSGTSNKVSNHRYWRLVVAVDNDAYTDDNGNHYGYIDISATDCEADSDIPQPGDTINQFGNRTDRTRQSAMVFDTVGVNAPSIGLFVGIGSGTTNAEHYSLEDRNIISIGYDSDKGNAYMRCYGDYYSGAPDASTYIKYDRNENKTTVRADLSIQSKVGDKTLGEIADAAESYALVVSNQVAMIPCDSKGNPKAGALPVSTSVDVYRGSSIVADAQIFIQGNNCVTEPDSGVVSSGQRVRVTSMLADSASVLFGTQVGDRVLLAKMELAKVRAGADGEPAVVYSVKPHAQVIVKSMTGEVNPAEIGCTVYKTVGDGEPVKTDDLDIRITREGVDSEPLYFSTDGGVSPDVPVTSAVTSVKFEGVYGDDVVDFQSVPVLADASDLEVGGVNLMRNTAQTLVYNNTSAGDHFNYRQEMTVRLEQGQTYTLSGVTNGVFGSQHPDYGNRSVVLWVFDLEAGQDQNYQIVSSSDMASDGSRGHTFTWTRRSSTYQLRINTYDAGTFSVGKIMLQRGNVCTDWSPAPEDVADGISRLDYLAEAMKESTDFIGGLMLGTLIQLGVTKDGIRRIMSGLSGIYNPQAPGGGPAFWAGGKMLDKMDYYEWDQPNRQWTQKQGVTVPADVATAMDRMDGSGYRGNGAITYDENGTCFNGPIRARGGFVGMMEQYPFTLKRENWSVYCRESHPISSQDVYVFPDWYSVGTLLHVESVPYVYASGSYNLTIDLPDFNHIWRGGFNTARQFYDKTIVIYNSSGLPLSVRWITQYTTGSDRVQNIPVFGTINIDSGHCAAFKGSMQPIKYKNSWTEWLMWTSAGYPCLSMDTAFPET